MLRIFKISIICLGFSFPGLAQIHNIDPDSAFVEARKLAFNGKRKESIGLLKTVLFSYPNYDEIRLFLASVYSWDERYKSAKSEYQILIAKDQTNIDYWVPYIKNEIYDDEPLSAIELAKKAMQILPDSVQLVILKATAEKNNNELQKAMITIKTYLDSHPDNKEAKDFKGSIKENLVANNISVSYSMDIYSEIYDPMHYYTIQYGKLTSRGSIIARYNLNNKFKTYGSQFEIDAYPSIAKGIYGYLNVGYSKSSIFPSWRFGAQLYKALPNSFEVSAGIRSLKFGEDYTHIYTGSIGKYFGSSFVFAVPYFINSAEGWSKSSTFTYRKYRANADQFFAISGGFGFSPEVNRFGFDNAYEPIVSLKSQKIDISNNFKLINNKNVIGAGVSLVRQESVFDPGKYFWIFSFKVNSLVGF
ncbi:YaiO family outer membrane beta-barrel protein [Lacihabitans sp. CCS-44]|uniref:YaiO family outer membrane beta-barrel protein n=1 Tax=Lacihabitans sp. CCS-44 TaxID=2487331 RepID=UPI0020CC9F59|nr:YaiO family outer membrane beta-barrel protein [Lacihabitans sp. CCS-44]MCP9756213.1 YaiO family outer membrane beta-barrel protein [Lacihabitans sp. CCS-44]